VAAGGSRAAETAQEMSKLTACYKIPLDQFLYVKHKVDKGFTYKTKIDDFEVQIQLLPYKKGLKHQFSDEEESTYCISEISVSVSKPMADEIPPVLIIGNSDDYSLRGQYFIIFMPDFQRIAHTAVKRTIKYFKYALMNPLLEQIPYSSQYFNSPSWFDEYGNEIKPGASIVSIKNSAGFGSCDFGIRPLTAELEPELEKAIENELKPELTEELLSDAQAAIFQNNYRRAVLEMAMACELAIKRTYFSKSTAAGRAHEFMEDRQKISMNITDYIDGVAEFALGETFLKATSKGDFINIQHLFRGRNKIVHRGDLVFRDDKNKEHRIDHAVLVRWWISVEKLFAWLDKKAVQ